MRWIPACCMLTGLFFGSAITHADVTTSGCSPGGGGSTYWHAFDGSQGGSTGSFSIISLDCYGPTLHTSGGGSTGGGFACGTAGSGASIDIHAGIWTDSVHEVSGIATAQASAALTIAGSTINSGFGGHASFNITLTEPMSFSWSADGNAHWSATTSPSGMVSAGTYSISCDAVASATANDGAPSVHSTASSSFHLVLTRFCNGDFNGDGDVGTDADIEAFFACLAGSCCATCGSADFNGDSDSGTDADIEAFFGVLAGGSC